MDRKKLGLVAFTVIYGLILYQFAFHPLLNKIRKLKNNLYQVKLQLTEVQKTVNKLASLQKKLRLRKIEEKKLEIYLFSPEELNNFIPSLTSLMKENGVEVVSVNFKEERGKIFNGKIIEVFVKGSFRNISSILQKIENTKKLAVLKNFHLERISSNPLSILGKIDIEVFMKK